MSDPVVGVQDNETVTLRWDHEMACYRVSRPSFAVDGPVELVEAVLLEREREKHRETSRALAAAQAALLVDHAPLVAEVETENDSLRVKVGEERLLRLAAEVERDEARGKVRGALECNARLVSDNDGLVRRAVAAEDRSSDLESMLDVERGKVTELTRERDEARAGRDTARQAHDGVISKYVSLEADRDAARGLVVQLQEALRELKGAALIASNTKSFTHTILPRAVDAALSLVDADRQPKPGGSEEAPSNSGGPGLDADRQEGAPTGGAAMRQMRENGYSVEGSRRASLPDGERGEVVSCAPASRSGVEAEYRAAVVVNGVAVETREVVGSRIEANVQAMGMGGGDYDYAEVVVQSRTVTPWASASPSEGGRS